MKSKYFTARIFADLSKICRGREIQTLIPEKIIPLKVSLSKIVHMRAQALRIHQSGQKLAKYCYKHLSKRSSNSSV